MKLQYPKVSLRNHTKLIRGITFKPHQKTDLPSDETIVCLRTANVQSNVDWRSLIYIPKSIVNNHEKILRKYDILISTANSNNLVGKCCLIRDLLFPSTLGGFISAIRSNDESLNPIYLYHFLNSDEIQALLRKISRQTTNISNLPTEQLLDIQIPLPPLPVQKRIAEILEKTDAAREKRRQTLALTEQFLQSAFLDMFGDPVTNPKGWEKVSIEDVVGNIQNDNPLKKPTQEYRYIDISSIDNKEKIVSDCRSFYGNEAPSRARQLVKFNDILVSTVRPNLNAVAIISDNSNQLIASTGFCVLRSTNINPYFLFHITKQKYFIETLSKQAKGASYPAVTDGQVKGILIPLPPISLQQQFAALVEKVEVMRAKQRESERELEQLFQSLMQRAFRGELVNN